MEDTLPNASASDQRYAYDDRSLVDAARESWPVLLALAFFGYVLLCKSLRYQRKHQFERMISYTGQQDLKNMTLEQAQAILRDLVELEFPFIFETSLTFALTKTYGIPTISSVLVKSGQLTSACTASKRNTDSGVLMMEMMLNPPSSERAIRAVSRINYLHRPYQHAGKIIQADLLYTLSKFALDPYLWLKAYEWRSLSDVEMTALGVFWFAIGERMGIDFTQLGGVRDTGNKPTWQNGKEWFLDLETWSEEYERTHMVAGEDGYALATTGLDLITFGMGPTAQSIVKHLYAILVGERVRKAMMLPAPPVSHKKWLERFFAFRRFFLTTFALPRYEITRRQYLDKNRTAEGRFHKLEWFDRPWYVKPTLLNRWGPGAWGKRMGGAPVPGDEGDEYRPMGYLIEEVGPKSRMGKGMDEYEKWKGTFEGGEYVPFPRSVPAG